MHPTAHLTNPASGTWNPTVLTVAMHIARRNGLQGAWRTCAGSTCILVLPEHDEPRQVEPRSCHVENRGSIKEAYRDYISIYAFSFSEPFSVLAKEWTMLRQTSNIL